MHEKYYLGARGEKLRGMGNVHGKYIGQYKPTNKNYSSISQI